METWLLFLLETNSAMKYGWPHMGGALNVWDIMKSKFILQKKLYIVSKLISYAKLELYIEKKIQ